MLVFSFNIAIVLLVLSFLTEAILAIHVFYRYPRNLQNTVFIFLLLVAAYWAGIYMLEIGFRENSRELRLILIKFEIFGWLGVPTLVALFFFIYSPLFNKKLLFITIPFVAIIPIVSIVGLMLNRVDGGFVYQRVDTVSDIKNIGFFLVMFYNYTMTVVGMILAGMKIFHPDNKEAIKKKIVVLISIFIPLAGNIVKNIFFLIFKITFEYDPTPISFCIAFVLLMYGIIGLKILNILPRAMQDLFNQMNEGVFVLSKDLVILKANKFADNLFSPARLDGEVIHTILASLDAGESEDCGIERIKRYFELNEKVLENCKTVVVKKNRDRCIFYVNIGWITDKKLKKIGYLVILHDYTKEALLEEKLADQSKKLKDTFEKLNPGVSDIITSGEMMMGEVCVTNHFCDVSGYSKFDVILGDKLTEQLMREFFRESHIDITKYHGYRDKIIGDQILSIFGIRKDECPPSKIHAFDAIFAAIRINELAERLSEKIPELIKSNRTLVEKNLDEYKAITGKNFDIDNWSFTLRHGISTSKSHPMHEIDRTSMTMMGDESGWDYTGMGGSIILSSRLEDQSGPSEISISENTYDWVKRFFVTEKYPPIFLKNIGNYSYYKLRGLKALNDDYFPEKVVEIAKPWEKRIGSYRTQIRIGATRFYEISKIVEWVPIDLEYVEHLKGVMNLGSFRAFWSIALANLLGVSEELMMFAAILDPIDYRVFPSLNIKFRYKLDKQLPEHVDYDRVNDLLKCSEMFSHETLPNGARLQAEILRFSRLLDSLTFDHTYLSENEKNLLPLSEAVDKLEKTEKWEPALIEAAKKLIR
jgi:class 3 adenylate cyclase